MPAPVRRPVAAARGLGRPARNALRLGPPLRRGAGEPGQQADHRSVAVAQGRAGGALHAARDRPGAQHPDHAADRARPDHRGVFPGRSADGSGRSRLSRPERADRHRRAPAGGAYPHGAARGDAAAHRPAGDGERRVPGRGVDRPRPADAGRARDRHRRPRSSCSSSACWCARWTSRSAPPPSASWRACARGPWKAGHREQGHERDLDPRCAARRRRPRRHPVQALAGAGRDGGVLPDRARAGRAPRVARRDRRAGRGRLRPRLVELGRRGRSERADPASDRARGDHRRRLLAGLHGARRSRAAAAAPVPRELQPVHLFDAGHSGRGRADAGVDRRGADDAVLGVAGFVREHA